MSRLTVDRQYDDRVRMKLQSRDSRLSRSSQAGEGDRSGVTRWKNTAALRIYPRQHRSNQVLALRKVDVKKYYDRSVDERSGQIADTALNMKASLPRTAQLYRSWEIDTRHSCCATQPRK